MAVERTEHVMGMPVTAHVRDRGFEPGGLDAAFAWLRDVDALFSTYRPESEISRLEARTSGAASASASVPASRREISLSGR